jgi:hypothetical protein
MRAALSLAYRQSTSDGDYEYCASGGNERRDKHGEFFVTASAAFEMRNAGRHDLVMDLMLSKTIRGLIKSTGFNNVTTSETKDSSLDQDAACVEYRSVFGRVRIDALRAY